MNILNKQYIVDEKGNRTGVILNIEDYREVLEDLEELESIRAYDAAKTSKEELIPFEQAIKEIEIERK
jgi:ribosomal 30S subunit maturation factor RimM